MARVSLVFVVRDARGIGVGEALLDASDRLGAGGRLCRHRRPGPARRPRDQELLRALRADGRGRSSCTGALGRARGRAGGPRSASAPSSSTTAASCWCSGGRGAAVGPWSVPGGRVEAGEPLAARGRARAPGGDGPGGSMRGPSGGCRAHRRRPPLRDPRLRRRRWRPARPRRPATTPPRCRWVPLAGRGRAGGRRLVPGLLDFLVEHGIVVAAV